MVLLVGRVDAFVFVRLGPEPNSARSKKNSLPRYIDQDGDTVRETSSDGMSISGTVVRGDIGPSSTSESYQATSEQLPFNEPSTGVAMPCPEVHLQNNLCCFSDTLWSNACVGCLFTWE